MHRLDNLDTDLKTKNNSIDHDLSLLKEIINKEKITSFAQPIIDLYSGKICGFELLARGVPPYIFFPE